MPVQTGVSAGASLLNMAIYRSNDRAISVVRSAVNPGKANKILELSKTPSQEGTLTAYSNAHPRTTMVNESKTHESASTVRSTPVLDCLDPKAQYGDFRDDLNRDGYAVIKGVLPVQKCEEYIDQIQEWLESFNLGYNRNDPSTVREECLPIIHQKGLIQAYGAPHETFTCQYLRSLSSGLRFQKKIAKASVFDAAGGVRSEPAVIDVFAKLFGTEDLLVAFDAMNVSLANRKDLPVNQAWAHQDQG